MADNDFWASLDRLVAEHALVIDRPKGSRHPRYESLVYPLDYGYLEGTTAGDGGGIDVWLGSGETREVTAIVCTVDMLKRDAEIKILLGCTDEEARIVHKALSSRYMSALLLQRCAPPQR